MITADLAPHDLAQEAGMQSLQGVQLRCALNIAPLEIRLPNLSFLEGCPRQGVFDALLICENDRPDLYIKIIKAAASDLVFDLSSSCDGHAHARGIEIREIEDPNRSAAGLGTIYEVTTCKRR